MVTDVLSARPIRMKVAPASARFAIVCLAAIAATLCVAAPTASRADWPVPIVVAQSAQLLRINGFEVRSQALTSALAPDTACALLERQWKAAGASALVGECERAGNWVVLTHPSGSVLETAQFQATARGSAGFVSTVDPLAAPAAKPRARLPLPAGTRVVNVVQSIESGDWVTQFTLLLPFPPTAALLKLRGVATERGWASVQAKGSSVIDFQRGATSARALAMPASLGTAVVLVEHDSSGLPR
ncbi:MAG: hypothetical protein ACREXI_01660 [Caldimonas sp.]